MTEAASLAGTDESEHDQDQLNAPSELDAIDISALLSSRVCHDLINPVGAVSSGLEVLDDPSMDETMREAALDLIRSGAKKAIALLSYARLAYGAAGGFGAEISLDDAKKALDAVFDTVKPDLVWRLGDGMAAKNKVKTLLILANAAADCVPRGGEVTIEGSIDDFTVTATGSKILLQEELARALSGDSAAIAPKFTPALIAHCLARDSGGAVTAVKTDEAVQFTAHFGA